jgi:hypothetical protein
VPCWLVARFVILEVILDALEDAPCVRRPEESTITGVVRGANLPNRLARRTPLALGQVLLGDGRYGSVLVAKLEVPSQTPDAIRSAVFRKRLIVSGPSLIDNPQEHFHGGSRHLTPPNRVYEDMQ